MLTNLNSDELHPGYTTPRRRDGGFRRPGPRDQRLGPLRMTVVVDPTGDDGVVDQVVMMVAGTKWLI